VACFKMINDRGGINGRKINLISLDNAFSPPKTIEQTRRLVESDGVFAVAGALGTPTNAAVQKYLNAKKVPNLFFTSGSEAFQRSNEFSLDRSTLSLLRRTRHDLRPLSPRDQAKCEDRRAP
jgi:ABC-type branched-subunit amino acid transport system substrate-binding protein